MCDFEYLNFNNIYNSFLFFFLKKERRRKGVIIREMKVINEEENLKDIIKNVDNELEDVSSFIE
jgi:hypothetical protein